MKRSILPAAALAAVFIIIGSNSCIAVDDAWEQLQSLRADHRTAAPGISPQKSSANGASNNKMKNSAKYVAVRLTPGTDVRKFVDKWCQDENIDAASLLSLVGSMTKASIRFADAKEATNLEGPFEIVSSTGTMGKEGCHIHISLADKNGKVVGGHLADGCLVNSTIELTAINLSDEWQFKRVLNSTTGYKELECVRKK